MHFNDVYDIEEQLREPIGGCARFLTVVKQLKAQFPDILTLFSGDVFAPSSLSTVYDGQQMIYPLNEFKVDVACLGNHDFDYQLPLVEDLIKKSKMVWLLSNVFDKTTNSNLAGALSYYIKDVRLTNDEMLKIGFIGLAEEEWLGQITEIPQDLIYYEDYLHCAERLSTQLREELGCSFIIALTHMRIPNDQNLIRNIPPGLVDLVLGGHDHVWHTEKINQSFYLKSGTNFRNLGLMKIQIQSSKIVIESLPIQDEFVESVESMFIKMTNQEKLYKLPDDPIHQVNILNVPRKYHLENKGNGYSTDLTLMEINITSQIPRDETMHQYVQEKIENYNLETLKVIGYSDTELETRFSKIRYEETNISNFFADLLRAEFQTDVSFFNTGTIRADELLPAGPITIQTLNKIFAIPDAIIVFRLNGRSLHEYLENGVSKYPSFDGRFLGISGITIKFNPNNPSLSRIAKEDIMIQGQPINYEKTYTAATKLYVALGYDGFQQVPEQDMIIDKTAGIPVLKVVLQFFDTVRKSEIIRKLSRQQDEELEVEIPTKKEMILKQMSQQNQSSYENRYQKFAHIVKEVKVVDGEPFIVIDPQIEGRITVI